MTEKKERFKIQTFFKEQQRSIYIIDRYTGKEFIYHVDEIELINNKQLQSLKKHLQKRMHFIRSGAYDAD